MLCFVNPTIVLNRIRSVSNTASHATCGVRMSTAMDQPSHLSAQSKQLFRDQMKNPLFDVSQVSGALGEALRRAQPEEPPYQFLYADGSDSGVGTDNGASKLVTAEVEAAVLAARRVVLKMFPGIDQPGGKLYPEFRSEACWRDLNSFARVAGYTCAVGSDKFYSDRGFDVLQRVYDDLDVPVPAVIIGVYVLWGHYLNVALNEESAPVTEVERNQVCERLNMAFASLVSKLGQLDHKDKEFMDVL